MKPSISNQKSKNRVAILMACYNRRELTLGCLATLAKQNDLNGQLEITVYLMDDASTDGTPEAVAEQYPEVKIISGTGNLFWNRGMHLAFKEAMNGEYDFYLWLNDDTHLYQDAIKSLVSEYCQLSDTYGPSTIVSGPTQDPDTGNFTYGGVIRHRAWHGWKFERVPPGEKTREIHATNGNCVLIPSNVAEQAGNLDPIYKHRWGDHDYCFRAIAKGCSIWMLSDYIGTCRWNSTEGTWKDTKLPMLKRYKLLSAPSGLMPADYWVYVKRHRGWVWFLYWLAPFIQIFLSSVGVRYFAHRK